MVGNQDASDNKVSRPDLIDVLQEYIPLELKQLPQWVCWRWVKKGNKWTKPPFQTNGQYADATDPSTWCDFTEAYSAWAASLYDPT